MDWITQPDPVVSALRQQIVGLLSLASHLPSILPIVLPPDPTNKVCVSIEESSSPVAIQVSMFIHSAAVKPQGISGSRARSPASGQEGPLHLDRKQGKNKGQSWEAVME